MCECFRHVQELNSRGVMNVGQVLKRNVKLRERKRASTNYLQLIK